MAEIEKYIAKRINKDIDPGAVQADGTRVMLPGELIDALNCSIGINGVVKSRKGNVLNVYADLGAGDNKVIGAFPYSKYNTIICFLFNSLGNHRVFEWDSETGIFTTLLSGASLSFGATNYITGGGVLDDLLIWNDGLNPIRFININDAKAGLYVAPYSKYRLALATQPPLVPPTFVIVTDLTVESNNIAKTTFQFAFNYIYTDNRESVYSPLSKLAWVRPYNNPDDNNYNRIDVTITIPFELIGIIKTVNIAYREGNSGIYNVFENIKTPTLIAYTRSFYNNGKSIAVSSEDQNLLSDAIPPVTQALDIIRNRVFCTQNFDGFDIDESTFNLTLALGSETPVVAGGGGRGNPNTFYQNKRYLKRGGIYGVGIVFFDDFQRRTFVKSAKTISVPYNNDESRHFINWSLAGTPPPGFTKYQIVLSGNRFHSTYFQCIPIIHLYIRDIKTGEIDNTQTDTTYNFKGKHFLKLDALNTSSTRAVERQYKYVYFQIPSNAPFIPDPTCMVRFANTFGTRFTNVLGVVGDFVIVDLKIHIDSTNHVTPIDWYLYHDPIEIFIQSDNFESVYYEVGDVFHIVNGLFQSLSGRTDGETYNLRITEGTYDFSPTDVILGPPIPWTVDETNHDNRGLIFEFPSGIFASSVVSSPVPIIATQRRESTDVIGESTATKIVYTNDYSRASSDFGRAHTIFDDERKKDFYNVVTFSNPFIENSYINGLNRFLPENQYPLPIDRGPIVSLIKAGNVLLAIHERFTSTLYIGEGLIRQGNDFILAKTEGVIGDDRQLQGGFGTINPESVIEIMDQAYWWDGYRGAVVRYSNAGLFAISSYGMRTYFIAKSRQLVPHRHTVKVVTGYDYENDEFLITFMDVKNDTGTVLVPGETWAFNTIKNEWKTRYSFVPECYASTETDLASFLAGQLWQHNKNELHNNFYGIQYVRRWKFISNPRLGRNKRWLNVHIKGEIAADPTSEFIAVVIKTVEGQESFIPAYEFEIEEGKKVAPILKDIHSDVEDGQLALRSGEDMVSEYAEVEIVNDRVDESECSQVNVVYVTQEFSV